MDFELLISSLQTEPDIEIRRYIPDKLAKLGDWRSTPFLGNILNDKKEPIILRNECAESLGKQGDPAAIDYLKVSINDEDPELRRTSVWSLGQIGEEECFHIILSKKNDTNLMVRKWVLKSISRIQTPTTSEFVEKLYDTFVNDDPKVFVEVIRYFNPKTKLFDNKILEIWLERSINYIQKGNDKVVQLEYANLLLILVERGLKFEENIVTNLIGSMEFENQLILPQLILTLAHINPEWKPTSELELSLKIQILKIKQDYRSIINIIESVSDYSPKQVALAIKSLIGTNVRFNEGIVSEIKNQEVKNALIIYRVSQNRNFGDLKNEIAKGEMIFELIAALKYLGPDAISTIQELSFNEDKNIRKALLQLIDEGDFINLERHEIIVPILHRLSSDRTWHVRRDARRLLRNFLALDE